MKAIEFRVTIKAPDAADPEAMRAGINRELNELFGPEGTVAVADDWIAVQLTSDEHPDSGTMVNPGSIG